MMDRPETLLLNYRTAVKYVPSDPAQGEPLELADEIVLLLDQRERIETGLRSRDPYLLDQIEQVTQIDKELLRKRHSLLSLAPWYGNIRQGKKISAFHWWWYLDQIPGRRCPECQAEMDVEIVSLTMDYHGAQETAPSFLVYICPRCGAKSVPALSLGSFQELLGSVLDRDRAQARHRPPAGRTVSALVSS
ncbi:MAG TPA: hypothetical protein ENJ31_03280 [Anaerolineae bacterium]|nr:hypothetical protein [Anaerolineae bacterium]